MRDLEQTRRELGDVCLSPPDPSWPIHFSRERERLRSYLGNEGAPVAKELQHYGSTAIPGLSAKPIIDMMAPVASLDAADALGDRLAAAGYRKIDAGFFKRRFFRRKVDGADLAFHLHLVLCPTWPVKNELLLRDWLMERPEMARAYEALKKRLAAEHGDDMPRYTEGKTLFLREAVNEARLRRGLPLESDWNE
jgi:GrpB-like predicted nucleotidyltransferase (UPF0157 family)